MKTLSKEMLIKKLIKEKEILKEINTTIKVNKITNQVHELYEWKYLTMGGIIMLRSLTENKEL